MTSKPNPTRQPETGGEAANPGVRTDRKASEIRSRSDDPGQSSYGGFKDQDPGRQHQGSPDAPGAGKK